MVFVCLRVVEARTFVDGGFSPIQEGVEGGRRTCLLESGDQYEAEELVSLRG